MAGASSSTRAPARARGSLATCRSEPPSRRVPFPRRATPATPEQAAPFAVGYTLTIFCLANSRKASGRCLAGKGRGGGRDGTWIRVVGDRPSGEILQEERRYRDGG